MNNSKVYLVGAGSGDPDLITLKGLKLIKQCDVIIYDNLANDVLLSYAKDDCIKLYAGKSAGSHYMSQAEINELIISQAKKGLKVVRLKGGDPFVFGRGGEEILALQKENIPFEVVSGISSSISVPASAGIPVTHRRLSRSFTVLTGHTADEKNAGEDYETLAKLQGTLVFLMGLGNIDKICNGLISAGKNPKTPSAVISNGTTSEQKTIRGNLKDLPILVQENEIKTPAIIVVGDVCSLDFQKTISMPLDNVNITVTGTENFASKLTEELKNNGAQVCKLAFLKIKELNIEKLAEAIENIEKYNWICFTSTNAIDIFFKQLALSSKDIRSMSGIKFAVIGMGTYTHLLKYGIKADLMPEKYTSADLGALLQKTLTQKDKILIPRALQGSDELINKLDKNVYDEIKIYDVVPKENVTLPKNTDFITFGSKSGVTAFFETIKDYDFEKTKCVAIGEITRNELIKRGIKNIITSDDYTSKGIVNTIIKYINQR